VNAYSRAVGVDPQFAEAYFNRASALERNRERKGAIADFQKVLALASAAPELKEAARARLAQLGATAARPTPAQRRLRVVLHYADAEDLKTLEPVVRALRKTGATVDAPEPKFDRGAGQVRFFYAQDEKAAAEVRALVQSELARSGTPLRLGLPFRDAAQFPGVQPGTVEVWLPPLSAPVGVAPIEQMSKY
jgi:tetratricopeptide (TPR) repeat protein